MIEKKQILISEICIHYSIDEAFIIELNQHDLIVVEEVESNLFVYEEDIVELEKFIRLKNELNINSEGIDIIINLLGRIEKLQDELQSTKERLSLYE